MKRLLDKLEELIFPRGLQCLCCGEFSYGNSLCNACTHRLQALRIAADENSELTRSAFVYDGIARQLVLLLKEECVPAAADKLAEGMAEVVREMQLPPNTVLTWVTMPDFRKLKRWIDHGETLCRAVAQQTRLPVRELIVRHGSLHTQRGLSREARLKNLTGSISCSAQISTPVLLVDDVMTTGATANACISALKAAGAPQVYVITATCVRHA